MARAVHTLLFILSGRVARADFSGSATPALVNVWRGDRAAGASLADAVRTALALGPACGRNVWVVCEDFWTQVLDFPSTTLAGLEDAQLVRAFAFEAETFSNIPGTDAVLGYKQADRGSTLRSYWVTVIEKSSCEAIQALVRGAGSKLMGMTHPAGVPSPIHEQVGTWCRIEAWQRITVCLAGRKTGSSRIEIINAGIAQPRAQTAIEAWIQKEKPGEAETLTSGLNELAPETDHSSRELHCSLADDDDFGRWASAWMKCLATEPKSVPLIVPAPPATPTYVFALSGIAAALVALGLCAVHWFYLNQETKRSLEQAGRDKQKSNALADVAKKESETRAAADKLVAQNAAQEQTRTEIEREFSARRGRVAMLLTSLAERRTNDLIVQSIQEDASGVIKINGITLDSAYAELFALKVSADLAKSGWEVRPFDKESANLLTNGGPWKFSLTVREPNQSSTRTTPVSTFTSGARRP